MPSALRHRATPDPPAEAPDEDALVAQARLDPAAFAPLYAGYLGPVYRYCYARLGTKERAEDATSLVFARALAALPRYQPGDRPGAFRSWLFTIAHHAVTDEFRRAANVPLPLDATVEIPDAAPSPEDHVLAADAHRHLRRLLADLPPDQRRVVELRLAGLSDQEIADVLGRSHGAVRTSQWRAVARLRRLFAAATPPEERFP